MKFYSRTTFAVLIVSLIATNAAWTQVEFMDQVQAPQGSSTSPSFTFDGDTNTGMFGDGQGGLGFINNGNLRMFLNNDGKIGIGTTTPSRQMALTGKLLVGRGSDIPSPPYSFIQAIVSAYSTGGRILAGIRVDNSASPPGYEAYKARGSLDGSLSPVQIGDQAGAHYFFGYDGSGWRESSSFRAEVDGTPSGGYVPGRLMFSASDGSSSARVDRMVIKSNGNVGIGTMSPSSMLEVDGAIETSGGVYVGAFSTNNLIDNSSNGSGSNTLYIGNRSITTAFTGYHYYRLGDADLQPGELTILEWDNGVPKLYRSAHPNDPRVRGIFQGVTSWEDSLGNICVEGAPREVEKIVKTEDVVIDINNAYETVLTEEIDYRLDQPPSQDIPVPSKPVLDFNNNVIGKKYPAIVSWKTRYHLEDKQVITIKEPVYSTKTVEKEQLKSNVRFDESTGQFIERREIKQTVIETTGRPMKNGKDAQPLDFAYSVAVIGDSYDDHSEKPLTGAWVTVDGGTIQNGDFLMSSSKPGYLQKWDGLDVTHIKGRARQDITEDTKTAYIDIL